MMTKLMQRLKQKRAVDADLLVDLRAVVKEVHTSLQLAVEEQQAAVEAGDEDKEERLQSQANAESHVEDLKATIAQRKAELDSTTKSIEDEKRALNEARAGVKKALAEVQAKETKVRQLEALEADVLAPFKDHQAKGPDGVKRLKGLCKTGKEFDVHPELLLVIPNILRKQPEKRRTFDTVAIQHLDAEISKRGKGFQEALKQGEQNLAESTAAVDAAQSALLSAKETKKRKIQELASAESNLDSWKAEVVNAKRRVRRFDKDMGSAERLLAQRRQQLERFESLVSKVGACLPADSVLAAEASASP